MASSIEASNTRTNPQAIATRVVTPSTVVEELARRLGPACFSSACGSTSTPVSALVQPFRDHNALWRRTRLGAASTDDARVARQRRLSHHKGR